MLRHDAKGAKTLSATCRSRLGSENAHNGLHGKSPFSLHIGLWRRHNRCLPRFLAPYCLFVHGLSDRSRQEQLPYQHCFSPSSLGREEWEGTRTEPVLLQPPHPHLGPPSARVQPQGRSAAPTQPLFGALQRVCCPVRGARINIQGEVCPPTGAVVVLQGGTLPRHRCKNTV
jgi:hypothetical protein